MSIQGGFREDSSLSSARYLNEEIQELSSTIAKEITVFYS